MGLAPLIINGIAHGFTVYGQAFILLCICLVPFLQSSVQVNGINADQNITDNVFAGYNVAALVITATKTSSGVFAEALCPIGDCPVAAHPT